jgi:hypothetical protein
MSHVGCSVRLSAGLGLFATRRGGLSVADLERHFSTRLLRLGSTEGTGGAAAFDPNRINQHLEGRPDGERPMTDDETARLLNDPFATLVLRRGIFPKNLAEILAALDAHNGEPEGVPDSASFLISEGGQIPFAAGVDKGASRLITVRSRRNNPELLISSLVPPGVSPRADDLLNEIQAWDPVNRTMHFYQRQAGAWFWCGQADMALEEPTRGKGPFDSHVNGYVVMKELKFPWVHWHGPLLGIAETAYAPEDPLATDPSFVGKDSAFNFETRTVRPLAERWNTARFDKAVQGDTISNLPRFVRQVLDSTAANLISTQTIWSQIASKDLDDLPVTFFVDVDGLTEAARLAIAPPQLRMTGQRYQALVEKYNLRVRGGDIDQPGDVPFCFTVPERAFEDVVVTRILVQRGVMSARLAACLVMVDFANPVGSPRRAALLRHVPDTTGVTPISNLDTTLPAALLAAAQTSGPNSPEAEFETQWNLGADAWQEALTARVQTLLAKIATKLDTDDGCDEIFRLAESRRREFKRRPLAEFGLSLPQAVGIPETAPILEMTDDATVRPRT